ncbi:glutamine amidotransferase [Agromyces sp. CFH 90414]|uniref:Glutamine amidotransferase n=1 Tax=Agromyces agglutinans TaxID=2662258 RepID=A0A6I2F6D7_9MICO|nr:glutamine amidotransferase [Agromyces agglutinans]MRG60169.1 glutamine amidotransferase [Agromyces agglutinans]
MTGPRPFLLVSARPEVEAVGPEYESFRGATGLDAGRLEHLRLDVDPLETVDLAGFAGVMVGGSPFNVATPEHRKHPVQVRVEADLARLAEHALEADLPVLFTCFGIGVLTRVLGGEVGREHPEQAAAVELRLTDAGLADPLTAGLPPRFQALAAHNESTSRLPDGATLLASSAACPVQLYRAGRRVYATQFHPEVTPADFAARAQVYRHHGYFPASELAAVRERLAAASISEPQRMLRRFVDLADA